jgi:hypothetical protein
MFREAQLADVFYAPIVLYCLVALILFVPLRWLLGRAGLLRRVWHPPLFELALYLSMTAVIILFLA